MGSVVARSDNPLATLNRAAQSLIGASLADETRRTCAGALRRLDGWLAGRQLDDSSLAEFVAHLYDAGRSPATLGLVVAAAAFRARVNAQPPPVGTATNRVLAGARRRGSGRGRGQAPGVGWALADAAVVVAASDGTTAGTRDAAILALASDAMLRVSEVAVLDVADLIIEPDGTGRLTVRRSKTDQEGAGAILFVGARTVRRIRDWLAVAGHSSGALFRRVRRGGRTTNHRLSRQAIAAIIALRAAAVGVENATGHSLRVGAAQSLAAAGASLVEMQNAGRWESPSMPARYSRAQSAARSAVARLRYGA